MTGYLSQIFRHPIKSIGREELPEIKLKTGEILPWDRAYAIAHSNARAADLAQPWAAKVNFLRGIAGPSLMAVEARFDAVTQRIRLTHPACQDLEVSLITDEAELLAWLARIWPQDAPAPTQIIHHPKQAKTDVPNAWVSIHTRASHAAVAQKLEQPDLSIHRWRGNLWLDGIEAWDELHWVGGEIQIGDVVFQVHQPITRCKATMANPITGERDLDTLAALQAQWGHMDFGVYASITKGGTLTPSATVTVL